MTPRFRHAASLAALVVLISACGTGPAPTPSAAPSSSASAVSFLPVQITTAFAVGDNRVVFTLTDPQGQKQIATPDRTLSIGYQGPNGATIASAPQTFVWAIEGVNGVYVGHANFPIAGQWTADFVSTAAGGPQEQLSFSFDVRDHLDIIGPGDAAPSIKTPTLSDVGGEVAKISSDPKPDPDFYKTSEADALAAKKPFVLIFATPKFCTSATCGPTLDKLKPVAAAHPEMTFINVEPYQLTFADGSLQPVLDAQGNLVPNDATNAFKLQTEPYLFVVGSDGIVKASFELVFSPDEIESAIKAVE
ncbi:MAG TPA: hypothetical protein VFI34_05615 [Candidatus Limnocylindrales bacterium]|nr:hypothetical protein [Candidatus Limnocylindrales bacterium]